jgi:hypothetical protein
MDGFAVALPHYHHRHFWLLARVTNAEDAVAVYQTNWLNEL